MAVMAASSFSFRKLLDLWENQELEAPGETATAPVFGQLLNLYLLHNNMNIEKTHETFPSLRDEANFHCIGSITTPRSTSYRTSGLTPFRNL